MKTQPKRVKPNEKQQEHRQTKEHLRKNNKNVAKPEEKTIKNAGKANTT